MENSDAPSASTAGSADGEETLVELALMFDLSEEEMESLEEFGEAEHDAATAKEGTESRVLSPLRDLHLAHHPFPDLHRFKARRPEQSTRVVPLDRSLPLPETPVLPAVADFSRLQMTSWQQEVRGQRRGETALAARDPDLTVAPIAEAAWQQHAGHGASPAESWIETMVGHTVARTAGSGVWQHAGLPVARRRPQAAQMPGVVAGALTLVSAESSERSINLAESASNWLERIEQLLQRSQTLLLRVEREQALQRLTPQRSNKHKKQRLTRQPRRRPQPIRQRKKGRTPLVAGRRYAAVWERLGEAEWLPRWQGWLEGVSQRVKEKMVHMVGPDNR
ncbi:MAG: hypothetical protein HQM06_06910 [Magnetococcales bacterium]|nr:hypothetical protein [Magnetococcales bacterium]